jgi:hypothetical protein
MILYGVYTCPRVGRKRRAFGGEVFETLPEAVAYFTARGGHAEIDPDGHDAADVFYQGEIYTVEPI